MKNGLSSEEIAVIHDIFRKHPEVRLVYLFGSRAKGSHAKGSDVDLAIMNKGVGSDVARRITGEFEESSLPYVVDLVNYPEVEHRELKEHIKRVGIDFYRRSTGNHA